MPTENDHARLGRALLADLPDAVICADRDGVIRYWNAGAVRIFGHAETEALGRLLDIIPLGCASHWEGFRPMMAGAEPRHGPAELSSVPAMTKSGTNLSIRSTVAPVRDESGGLVGIVAALRDVTRDHLGMTRLRNRAAKP